LSVFGTTFAIDCFATTRTAAQSITNIIDITVRNTDGYTPAEAMEHLSAMTYEQYFNNCNEEECVQITVKSICNEIAAPTVPQTLYTATIAQIIAAVR
jgi:hypothetical protein